MIISRHTGNRRQIILDSYLNKSAVRVVCFLAEVYSTFYSSCFTLYFCHILRRIYHSKHLSFIQWIKTKYQLNMMYCVNYHSCLSVFSVCHVLDPRISQGCVHDSSESRNFINSYMYWLYTWCNITFLLRRIIDKW